MLPEFVYKIATFEQWDEALEKGTFDGAPVDLDDGYIHFSTTGQVRETATKHFKGQDGLMLVKVATAPMARHYKMETSRGGALFPHLYARLPVGDAVIWEEMQLQADGSHRFPDWFAEDESRSA